jgi:hypothetical protein
MIYPLVSWGVTVPAFTITVTAGSAVSEVLNVPAGTYDGWKTTGLASGGDRRVAAAGSLAKVIGDALETHTSIVSVASSYGVLSTGAPGYRLLIVATPAAQPVEITATNNAAALALFGLSVGVLRGSNSDPVDVPTRTAGVWRPNTDGGRQEPDYTVIGSGAWSPYNPSANDRIRIGGQLAWLVSWEFVQASDITREINGLADYLPLAGRAAGDTDGTLDDLVEAAAQGLDLSLALPPIGTAAVDYRTCIIPDTGNLSRSRFTTEAAVGGRMYSVTLPLLETREVTA